MGMDDATLGKLVRLRKEETCRTEELKAGIMARAKRISNLKAALQGDLDRLQVLDDESIYMGQGETFAHDTLKNLTRELRELRETGDRLNSVNDQLAREGF